MEELNANDMINRKKRNFVRIIEEICEEEGIKLKCYSDDWVFKLNKNGSNQYILGYQFGLNTDSVQKICRDKSAASEVMNSFSIPNVEHYFFIQDENNQKEGNWERLIHLLKCYGKIVCKDNEGAGGKNVYYVTNEKELEYATFKIFQKSKTMAVSPYYDIENEYRIVVLDEEIQIIFSKQRPYIIGDGIRSIRSLIIEYLSQNGNEIAMEKLNVANLEKVLDKGELFYLTWKHNLGEGAIAIIEKDLNIIDPLIKITKKVVAKMNIRFAAIDIVKCREECQYRVLEINSGVTLEHFSEQNKESYEIAKSIYKNAILALFELNNSGCKKL